MLPKYRWSSSMSIADETVNRSLHLYGNFFIEIQPTKTQHELGGVDDLWPGVISLDSSVTDGVIVKGAEDVARLVKPYNQSSWRKR